MELTGIVQIISTVGFPIAMCLALFYYLIKKDETHATESKEFADALNKNTVVLQQLTDTLQLTKGGSDDGR